MNRREAASAIVALFAVPARLLSTLGAPVALTAVPARLSSMLPPATMRVRIVTPPGRHHDLMFGKVLCERTGDDLSHRFPIKIAHRLRRSFETQRPVRVSLFRLRDGHPYFDGHDVAREMATVLVTSIEEA